MDRTIRVPVSIYVYVNPFVYSAWINALTFNDFATHLFPQVSMHPVRPVQVVSG